MANSMPAPEQMARFIDHTLLKPEADEAAVHRLCDEAVRWGFKAVCVNSVHVAQAAASLAGSTVRVCSVVGFPLGAMHPGAKAFEARTAVEEGAVELDMVMRVGALKSGANGLVEADIRAVREAAGSETLLKVIVEACLLTDREKVRACRIAVNAGADFVKTSTGFSSGGATAADVALMRQTVGPGIGVKASGGIKDRASAAVMIQAGADRIGTSSGVAIVSGRPHR